MYSVKNLITKEPAVIAGSVIIILQALVAFAVIELTVDQLAAVNAAIVAVLALLVRGTVTPVATLRESDVSVVAISDEDLAAIELYTEE